MRSETDRSEPDPPEPHLPRDPGTSRQLARLSGALSDEASAVEQIRHALVRQRAAIAASDRDKVRASLSALDRAMLTFEEARRRRESVVAGLAPGAPRLDELDSRHGVQLSPAAASARRTLRLAAVNTAREVAINRHVLERAVAANEELLRHLLTAVSPPAGYAPTGPSPASATSALMDRTV
jgi:hypothetical protein